MYRIGILSFLIAASASSLSTQPVVDPPARSAAMNDPINSKLKNAVTQFSPFGKKSVQPAIQQTVQPAVQPSAVPSPQPLPKNIKKAVVISNLYATTDLGGHVSAPGPRGNWHTKPTDAYIALPSFDLRNRKILVRSRKTGIITELPVWDTGPWSTNDDYVSELRRPRVEQGISNIYKRVPRTAPAADLSPAAWRQLQIDPGGNGNRAANYSNYIDIIVIVDEIPPNRRAD